MKFDISAMLMSILEISLILLAIAVVILALFTCTWARRIAARYPPIGRIVDIGGYKMHAVHVPGPAQTDRPAVVFIHGASGNLADPMTAFRQRLAGKAEMLFLDRPGHGWSQRGPADNDTPDGQARAIAALMDHYKINQAIIVGHSLGGAVALNLAMEKPNRVAGLLLLSAASHPWPGGGVDLHYTIASIPVLGHVFTWLVTLPIGLARITTVARCIFCPGAYPQNYVEEAKIALVLRPRTFRHNARDVTGLYRHFERTCAQYANIQKPTIIISGQQDGLVPSHLHSAGLATDISGAQWIDIDGVGHKPDYNATDLCLAALDKLSGNPVDLDRFTFYRKQDNGVGL